MIRVQYPSNSDLEKLKKNYLNLFDIKSLERRWRPVNKKYGIELKELLIGDFSYLVDIYYWYKSQQITGRQKRIYESIFNYESMQPDIARFFMDNKNGFSLSTCHYCNMAYINTYSKSLTYVNQLDFINNALEEEWRELFDYKKLSKEKLTEIFDNRPFDSLDDFNKKKFLCQRIETYKGFNLDAPSNHFDLDHLLPKSICPIVGLSLFNFVPSCQVCNEKLKRAKELGDTKEEWLKISPTYQQSSFDNNVTIKLVPLEKCSTFFELQRNNGNYRLEFETNQDKAYEKYISILHLKERYNYHKKLALHILDLKERYSPQKCKKISRLLSGQETTENKILYSESQIKSDILQEELSQDRCFAKLRRDMINKN